MKLYKKFELNIGTWYLNSCDKIMVLIFKHL